jgi:SAM-dependent methyltransferase
MDRRFVNRAASGNRAVDISKKMLVRAKRKLHSRPNVVFVREDLLHFCARFAGRVDYIASAYAIHHLLPQEKHALYGFVSGLLEPGGAFVCGDLMWENERRKAELYGKYPGLMEGFEDEFPWDLEKEIPEIEARGFGVETKRFSDISWGLRAMKL